MHAPGAIDIPRLTSVATHRESLKTIFEACTVSCKRHDAMKVRDCLHT